MREIARFYDAGEAKIAAGFLRAQGFDVSLPEENHLGSAPHLSIALGGYRILATDEEAFLAKATLDERRADAPQGGCPQCGSNRVARQRQWFIPLALFGFLAAIFPFAPPTDSFRCANCGNIWKDTDDEP
ncbi:MAG: hypothetical protein AAF788_04355 [Pseudomonadota bacterium]